MENTFQEHIKGELKSMDQRLSDLEDKMTSIDTKLTQVVDAILGNPLTKSGGFVSEVQTLKSEMEQLKRKMERQEDFRKKISWTVGILATIIVALQYLSAIYSNVK